MNVSRVALAAVVAGRFDFGAPAAAQAGPAINPDCEKLLPAKLVEQAAGRAPITLMGRDPRQGAGGDCNYTLGGKTMLLLVNLNRSSAATEYQRYKTNRMYRTDQQPIPGLGDEAFTASIVMLSHNIPIVAARKGKTLVVMSTFLDMDPNTAAAKGAYLTRAQLIELARGVLARS